MVPICPQLHKAQDVGAKVASSNFRKYLAQYVAQLFKKKAHANKLAHVGWLCNVL